MQQLVSHMFYYSYFIYVIASVCQLPYFFVTL